MKTGGAVRREDDTRQWCEARVVVHFYRMGSCSKLANWQIERDNMATVYVCTSHKLAMERGGGLDGATVTRLRKAARG